ncbi:hypothetical protein ABN267_12565 [Providencia rettgeri]|uniref:hypothetical protein n=1 Tax=Providencia sp. PROV069 TaxID=2949795 RepID=UPI00234B6D93|nr:hypothetical protein [Providencia sp. PROV069]
MLYIVTFNNYFGQHLNVESSLNVEEIKKMLIEMSIETEIIEVSDLIKSGVNDNDYYWITSHQNHSIKKYLNDVVLSLFSNKNNNLITSLELYFAHENKGIQSLLYDNGKNIKLVKQNYLINDINIEKRSVFKMIDGAGSSGVYLVNDKKDINNILKKKKFLDISILSIIKYTKRIAKKILNKYNQSYDNYQKKQTPYVLQMFMDGLKHDYKVLVFWNKVYVLERKVRKNDFRASGSGLFNFIEPDDELIRFCINVREKIKTPFVSLDIIKYKDDNYYCIEYQCTHFGPYTQINSQFFYQVDAKNKITKHENNNILEYEYAYSIFNYLKIEKN